ncbi:serine hydrolase [Xanthovirga aplysinae]|uniref:serine hydrolase n=1 Tax=Xanthovirga aplysinae TaxID=2529853 RepID=UPI0012BD0C6D|nr:serine hydrolase [Xanthovirga aplysinae]MTI32364.1 serine hydrolase [Xanthovirga aplysinae]
MSNLRPGILLFLIFFTYSRSYSQLSSKEVDQLVENTISKFKVAGGAVGIVKDGEIIHAKGYGLKSINSKKKVNKHTQFAIASNTKAFTATALAILVEQGKIKWEDKVIRHLPEFKMYNNYVTENFNIQDLLTHRSGLAMGAGDLMVVPPGSDFTIDDILSSFQYFVPQSTFRTSYNYSNLMYLVAGELISRVSNMSYEAFIEQHIFQPLNMNHSYSDLSKISDKSNLATPHLSNSGKLKEITHFEQTVNSAAGGIYSNVEDLCQWMLIHLNKGKYGKSLDSQLFTEANQREMWKIHNSFVTNTNERYNFHFSGYGLGWDLKDIRGNMAVSHTGLLPGMASQTILIPDLKLGIVVLINSSDEVGFSPTDPIAFSILDSYLGLDDFNWMDKTYQSLQKGNNQADSTVSVVWKTVKSNANHQLATEDYIGVYKDRWFGKVEIFLNKGQLWFKSQRSPKLNGKMSYYKANAFAIRWEYQDLNGDAFAIFSLDEEGKAQSIRMKGISPEIDFSFDFQDLDLQRVE